MLRVEWKVLEKPAICRFVLVIDYCYFSGFLFSTNWECASQLECLLHNYMSCAKQALLNELKQFSE